MNRFKSVRVLKALFAMLFLFATLSFAQIEFTEHEIADDVESAKSAFAADIDSDGDIDVLASRSNGVYWYENNGEQDFTVHLIYEEHSSWIAKAIDMDGDDDIDVIAALYNRGYSWWENDGDQEFTEHVIDTLSEATRSIDAADIDNDGDMDIVGVAQERNGVKWFENDGDFNFASHIVFNNYGGRDGHVVDLDGDNDIDIIARGNYNGMSWWENDGIGNFTFHTYEGDLTDPNAVYSADIDGDGDIDVLCGALHEGASISWWENEDNQDFTQHTIARDEEYHYVTSVYAEDLDWDGDVDVLSAGFAAGEITWWENDGNGNFTYHPITEEFGGSYSVYAEDMDGDRDIDLLCASMVNDKISWFENNFAPFPPHTFSLASPPEGSLFDEFPVNLIWNPTTDPDPFDTTCYDIWIDTNNDLSTAVLAADSIADTTLELTELNDDLTYYWTVRATDSNTPGTWADDTLSFSVAMPELPSSFALLSPDNEDTLEFEDAFIVGFEWNSSTDPDPGDEVWYNLRISVALEDDRVRYLNYSHLQDTSLNINIPDTLQLDFWNDYLNVSWRVLAVSGEDVIECDERFTFSIAPYNITVESSSDAIPAIYSIAALYPNPFNSSLTVVIGLPRTAYLKVRIFNITGREIAVLTDNRCEPGYHKFSFEASELSSGIYFIHATAPGALNEIQKVALIR